MSVPDTTNGTNINESDLLYQICIVLCIHVLHVWWVVGVWRYGGVDSGARGRRIAFPTNHVFFSVISTYTSKYICILMFTLTIRHARSVVVVLVLLVLLCRCCAGLVPSQRRGFRSSMK